MDGLEGLGMRSCLPCPLFRLFKPWVSTWPEDLSMGAEGWSALGCPCWRDPQLESGPEQQLLVAPRLCPGSSSPLGCIHGVGWQEHPVPEGLQSLRCSRRGRAGSQQSPDVAKEAAEE